VLDTDLALDPASEHFIEITGRRHVAAGRRIDPAVAEPQIGRIDAAPSSP
jgi:hypothetical protein